MLVIFECKLRQMMKGSGPLLGESASSSALGGLSRQMSLLLKIFQCVKRTSRENGADHISGSGHDIGGTEEFLGA
jgi:hypothetical protein